MDGTLVLSNNMLIYLSIYLCVQCVRNPGKRIGTKYCFIEKEKEKEKKGKNRIES